MKSFRFALLLALGAGALAVPAHAFPTLEVTACDTLSLDPLRVRTTFDISSVYGAGYTDFIVHPYPEGLATFFDCASPAAWHCDRWDSEPYVVFTPDDSGWNGEQVTGFSIVSNQAAPCVLIIFGSVVLGSEYSMEACLRCDAPVPTRPASWGSVKSLYR
jgi:hypothetical protein